MKKHEQAFELFKESNGKLTNAEIAKRIVASETTVRKWKSRYKWLEQLGIKKTCHTSKRANVTTEKKVNPRNEQKKRVIDALIEAGTYSPALDLLIEIYLDAYLDYYKAKEEGFAEEKQRREVARLLGQLGLDGKNKELIKKSGKLLAKGDEEQSNNSEPVVEDSKLIQFRQRRMRES